MAERVWLLPVPRDRASAVMIGIDRAPWRIRSEEYAHCKKTGEPIGLRRLVALQPATTTAVLKRREGRRTGVAGVEGCWEVDA